MTQQLEAIINRVNMQDVGIVGLSDNELNALTLATQQSAVINENTIDLNPLREAAIIERSRRVSEKQSNTSEQLVRVTFLLVVITSLLVIATLAAPLISYFLTLKTS